MTGSRLRPRPDAVDSELTMNLETWNALELGDYVLYGPARALRKIIKITKKEGRTIGVTFWKLNSAWSWFGPTTVLCRGDRYMLRKVHPLQRRAD
jgi:hypothetical protein